MSKVNFAPRGSKFFITFLVFLMIVFLGALGFSVYKIFLWQNDSNKAQEILESLGQASDHGEIDFSLLKDRNPDTVAWLTVPGTKVDYPVVQAGDNDYYLEHSFDREQNSAGWIFADYRNDFDNFDQNTIIYGHGFLNQIMFGTLKNTLEGGWYSENGNRPLRLVTEDIVTSWEVFSAYRVKTTDDYLDISFNNDDEFSRYIDLVKSRSVHEFNVLVNPDDKILTLSTCYNQSERIVLHAKLVNGQ